MSHAKGPFDPEAFEFFCDVCSYTIEKNEIRCVSLTLWLSEACSIVQLHPVYVCTQSVLCACVSVVHICTSRCLDVWLCDSIPVRTYVYM